MKRPGQCPTCRRAASPAPDNPWRPFCSERCRLIDLGAWMDGSHRLPSGEPAADGADAPGTGVPRRH